MSAGPAVRAVLGRPGVRLLGWLLAANALALLVAASVAPSVRDAAQRLVLLCGLG